MATPTLILGANNWAIEEDNILGYALGSSSKQYLPREISFTRGSDATYTDSTGVVRQACWNLLQYSEEFDNAIWSKQRTTVSSNAITSPIKTLTADKLVETNVNGTHIVFTTLSQPSTSPRNQVFSFYAKSGERNWIATSGDMGTTYFNLNTGQVGTVTTSTFWFSGITASMENVGDGWYRCVLSGFGFFEFNVGLKLATADGTDTYTGDGISGAFIWGAQLVQGTQPLAYLRTTDRLNVPRVDSSTGSKAFLLEPQRTNVVLYSSDLSQGVWSKTNYTLSSTTEIQGLPTTRITKNATNNGVWNGAGARDVINTVGTFASGVKTFSVLLRKGNTAKVGLLINGIVVGALSNVGCEFDFATETFTNVAIGLTVTFEKPETDVYRFILVCNDTGTGSSKNIWIAPIDSSNNTVTNGYVDVAYFQWELGSYATTYIPTQATTVTRLPDSATRTGISSLIGQTEGTFYIQFSGRSTGTNSRVLTVTGGGQEFLIFFEPAGTGNLGVFSTNTGLFYIDTGGANDKMYKVAFAYSANNYALYVNGVSRTITQSANTFSSLSRIDLNQKENGTEIGKTVVNELELFTSRLSNAELATLTTL